MANYAEIPAFIGIINVGFEHTYNAGKLIESRLPVFQVSMNTIYFIDNHLKSETNNEGRKAGETGKIVKSYSCGKRLNKIT